MKFHIKYSAALVFVVVCSADAGIETGEILRNSNTGVQDLVGIPIGLDFGGYTHNGVDFTDAYWDTQSPGIEAQFAGGPEGDNALGFGALVSPGLGRSSSLYWGSSDTSYGEHFKNFIGEVGEFFFIGFTFVDASDPNDIIRNFGYMQVLKLNSYQYDWIGYAYETEDNTAIEIFNLVPAPSGIAVLGLAGLGLTRRRRG